MHRCLTAIITLLYLVPTYGEPRDTLSITSDTTRLESRPKHSLSRFLHKIVDIDSNYIRPNRYNCTTMLYGEQRWRIFKISGSDMRTGKEQSISFEPYSTMRVGPYIGYSILLFGYTVDIGTRQTSSDRSNIYLSIYAPMFGVDYIYEKSINNYKIRNLNGFGDDIAKRVRGMEFPGLNTHMTGLHIYYVFNHHKFSYPAAYSQSGQQLRSAGSVMLGFNYTSQRLNFDPNQLPDGIVYHSDGSSNMIDALKVSYVDYKNYSVSAGYGSNWVFARNMLFNLTLTPTLGYNINRGERLEFDYKLFSLKQLHLDLISRSALVWNTGKYYAGAAMVAHTYSYKKSQFSISNSNFTFNIYAGLNFWLKKAYRKKRQHTQL